MSKLNIKEVYLNELKTIFKKYCPKADIWAYGSRLNGDSHDGSDLDLVVKNFNDNNCYLSELKELLNNSNIPFLIDIHEYNYLPQNFKDEILKKYVSIKF